MLVDAIRAIFRSGDAAAAPAAPDAPAGPAREDRLAADPAHLAACVLLLDVAHADGEFSDDERSHLLETLERHFALPPNAAHTLMGLAEHERSRAIDHFQYTNVLRQHYDLGQKMVLAEVLWGLVLADGAIDAHEHYLTRKIANLLGLEPGYLSMAKRRAAGEQEPPPA